MRQLALLSSGKLAWNVLQMPVSPVLLGMHWLLSLGTQVVHTPGRGDDNQCPSLPVMAWRSGWSPTLGELRGQHGPRGLGWALDSLFWPVLTNKQSKLRKGLEDFLGVQPIFEKEIKKPVS